MASFIIHYQGYLMQKGDVLVVALIACCVCSLRAAIRVTPVKQ